MILAAQAYAQCCPEDNGSARHNLHADLEQAPLLQEGNGTRSAQRRIHRENFRSSRCEMRELGTRGSGAWTAGGSYENVNGAEGREEKFRGKYLRKTEIFR